MSTKGISEKKREIIENLKQQLLSYPIIGLVKIDNIGARIVQKMRKDLRTEAKIIMAKNSLMRIAVSETKQEIKGIEKLLTNIVGSCAFLLTNTNPYRLASFMDKNKVPAPAKAGQIAPNDVIIRPMNTGIPPGPIISELQSLGLKTKIEGGQIRIVEEAVVTKEGDRVNRTVALLLRRLNIDPFEAGLSFIVALEKGAIIPGDSLIIDYDYYEQNLQWAYNSALNLAINAGIVTKQSLAMIIVNANQFAINLSVNSVFITTKTFPTILSKSVQGSLNVAAKIAISNPEALSAQIQERLKTVPKTSSSIEVRK
ncbi:MAG: 50S ribosomal protein L10 [Candidatus Heimdallarchaeota archaeon]|nr:50S ribosomal protein L10 [Candidatus Heimdallarchaeota archaeon]MCK4955394.1 50S ribosomal protein L10 [Candidatus Heimdallarchaeota archaeon]